MIGSETRKKLTQLKVLLIDDQADIRSVMRDALKGIDVGEIFEASSAHDAQKFVDTKAGKVNFIICDWNMPDKTGFDFLRQVRGAGSELPFLMVTGRCDETSVLQARDAGVTAYIRKPFTPEQLEEKILLLVRRG